MFWIKPWIYQYCCFTTTNSKISLFWQVKHLQFDIGRCHRWIPKAFISCFSLPVTISVGRTHQRQCSLETRQCWYGGSGNDLPFTWKKAFDNWVEDNKTMLHSKWLDWSTRVKSGESDNEGLRTHLYQMPPAVFKAL